MATENKFGITVRRLCLCAACVFAPNRSGVYNTIKSDEEKLFSIPQLSASEECISCLRKVKLTSQVTRHARMQ